MYNHNKDWKSVPMPRRIKNLFKDAKGMPVPYVVLHTSETEMDLNDGHSYTKNKYHFAINDVTLVQDCVDHHLCTICGHGLQDDAWVIGGPMSAFLPNGVFGDLPVHHDCGEYALKVCPYLAVPSYAKVKDPEKIKSDLNIEVDSLSQGNTRVPFFVFAKLNYYSIDIPEFTVIPDREELPVYHEVQYWNNGERITPEQAVALHQAAAPAVVTLLSK